MKFYVLEKPAPGTPADRVARTDAIREEGFAVGEAIRCPKCGRFLSSLRWLPPYRVELETWGREYGDVVEIVAVGGFAVSDFVFGPGTGTQLILTP